jgi:hypothetical protein
MIRQFEKHMERQRYCNWGIAAAVVASSLISASASQSAAGTAANAQLQGAGIQKQMYDQTMANEQPFIATGQQATQTLQGMLNDPNSYLNKGLSQSNIAQFLNPYIQYGVQGAANQANLTGGAGGNTLAAIAGYLGNQGYLPAANLAQSNQQNIISNLGNIASQGVSAGSAGTTGAPQFASSIGNMLAGAGGAQAAGTVGQANALAGGINNAAGWYTMNNMMNSNPMNWGTPAAGQALGNMVGAGNVYGPGGGGQIPTTINWD